MRLIDGDALEREGWSLCRTFQKDKDTMVYEVKKPSDFPVIEPERTGHWIDNGYDTDGTHYIKCSSCECDIQGYAYDYCPNCGAKMESET